MRATVYLREEKMAKMVRVTDRNKPEVEEPLIDKWQGILDNIALIMKIPAALVMRLHEEKIEVFLSSRYEGNPYHTGDTEALGIGLYCETVIGRQSELMVKDARHHEEWKTNPDMALGMVSYYGLPIHWPDMEVFGTICVLDTQERFFSKKFRMMFRTMKESIEKDLRLLVEKEQLQEQALFLRHLIDTIPAGIVVLDEDLRVRLLNERARSLMGLALEELDGKRISEVIEHPEIKNLEDHFVESGVSDYPIQFGAEGEKPRHYLVDYQSLYTQKNELSHVAVNIRNVSHMKTIEDELNRKNEVLSQLAVRDRLTSLYNHVTIHELLLKHLEESIRYHSDLAIAMIDIDNFKEINDSYGHRLADTILSEVAGILKENVRGADIVGRYGGNRFMVIMPQTDLDSGYQVIERIRLKCESRDFNKIDLTVSAGLSKLEHESSMDRLVNCVEQALYRAKSIGKNVVVVTDRC